MSEIIVLPPNRAIVLRNKTCAYCGLPFGPNLPETKEHVIGRRFVPLGSLANQWNLILYACEGCNGDKSDLEDDISAISMMPDELGQYAIDDPRIKAEVARKAAKSKSRRTGKAVADSREKFELNGAWGPATFTFTLTAPAQIDEMRLYRLAHYHFRGFFYWTSYERESNRGGFVPGGFFPLAAARRSDWGAPHLRWFKDIVRNWDVCVHAIGADKFFKLLVYRHPEKAAVWSWALEWNQSIRVIGFAGDEKMIASLVASAPNKQMHLLHETEKERFAYKVNSPLAQIVDDLFTIVTEIETDEAAVPRAR
ncbi:HNH endonuclease [Paraburkholderia kirstenboschensis]|uniref:HNH endonuclease n=1 Tax=Paraburkholderia kirstenboschensis TaxID=1245436 RepID=A0ABZ0ERH3_9BURK|nr:HNH endonuclease [Paraburkholderia kirstenboschensis]WOD18977.1 HNH endonuclease [Paraburkholderia kirstenboschensis]